MAAGGANARQIPTPQLDSARIASKAAKNSGCDAGNMAADGADAKQIPTPQLDSARIAYRCCSGFDWCIRT